MIYELDAYVNGSVTKFFMKQFCFDSETIICPVHCHKYAEIHILVDGQADFLLDTSQKTFGSGDIFLIPADMYHCCTNAEATAKHFAFQAAIHAEKPLSGHLSEHAVSELMSLLPDIQNGDSCCASLTSLSSLLTYTCSALLSDKEEAPRMMTDIPATIYEFVSQNYNRSIKISDLADVLHFSEKQTERLVKKYTGVTFKTLLTRRRLLIAEFLEKSTDMNAHQIATYVGYTNYSGLWKARQKES